MKRVLALVFAIAPALGNQHETARAAEPAPCFEITPKRALLDDQISVRLLHLKPRQRVAVRAQMVRGANALMKSRTEFVADEQGTVDVGAVPKDARDKQVAPLRVLWSMKRDPEAKEVTSPRKGPLAPYTVTFTAEADGKDIATGTLELLALSPEVVRTEVREKGLAGTFFRPAGNGRWPGVITFGGSGGGLFESSAALLASRGYAALALAYFNYGELPKNLVEIPLEYFETALDWMEAQESVRGDRLAVMGPSRGGELALLLGATFPKVKAVVASVPSHVVWGAYSEDAKDFGRPAWTFKGKPVPSMLSTPPDRELAKLVSIADPTVHTPWFALCLANAEAVRQAAIPVENIQGPVLLISGEDDKLWPSAYMASQVMKRLTEHRHPYPDKHFSYKGCGHIIGVPNMPVPPSRTIHSLTKVEMEMGGTAEATAFAAWDSRQRVLEFLEKHLKKSD